MKAIIIAFILFAVGASYAQFDSLPSSPLDSDMGGSVGNVGGTVNQLTPMENERRKENEKQKEEELLENRYDVPDEKEEKEFNLNGTSNP